MEWILRVVDEVTDPRSHDEVTHANAVATDEFASMVTHLRVSHLVELLCDRQEILDVLWLVSLGTEEDFGAGTKDICPSVNDRIMVERALVVLRVVVAVLDAEHAEDGTELSHALLLAIDGDLSVGESTSELATLTSGFLGFPALSGLTNLLVLLTMVLEHLRERISTSIKSIKVVELHALIEKILAFLSATS